MKTFFATKYDNKSIELQSSRELDELYNTATAEENFILKWNDSETKMTRSEVVIATNIVAKIKTGDIKLTAHEVLR
jgi:hypothetical protein